MGRMKVLLTQDVPEVGLAGEVHTVAGGFARNYLMPRGMAILATAGSLKQADDIREAGVRRRAKERANAEAQAQVLNGQKLLFPARAGENNRLYGSVTSSDIAEQLEGMVDFEVDRRRIQLAHPIRDLGIYDIELRLMPEVSATFKVAVVREGESWDDAEKRAAEQAKQPEPVVEEAAEFEEEARLG